MAATLLPESKGTTTDCATRRTAVAASTHSAVSASGHAHDAAASVRPDQFAAIYDEQCEICQAFISWLKLLDRHGKITAVPIVPELLAAIHPSLELDACLRELHVVTPQGNIRRGWDAVAELARLFPATFFIGWLGTVPPFRWLGRAAYRFVARNRYAVSKCRGGACRVARPDEVKQRSFFGTFWSCYLIGLLIRLPLIAGAGVSDMIGQWSAHIRTFRRRIDFPGGKLTVLFLGGISCDVVPLLFGELFTAILYDGVLIDPGSPRMRRSLARHLRRMPPDGIRAGAATHHHEEHVGKLNWAAQTTATPLYLSSDTASLLASPGRLPCIWKSLLLLGTAMTTLCFTIAVKKS